MAMTRMQAEKLCSKPELQLFRSSQRDQINRHSKKQLERLIDRTRKLRDKQQDLFKRQRLATRSRTGTKGGPTKDANARTEQKSILFDEILKRFEARLVQLEEAARREVSKLAKALSEEKPRSAAKPKAKAKAAAKPKPAAKAKAKPKAAAKSKAKAKVAPKSKAKAKAKVAPKSKAKAKAKVAPKLALVANSNADATTKAPANRGAAKSTRKEILTPAKAKASSAKAKAKSKTTHMSRTASLEGRSQDLQKMRGKAIQGHVRARGQRKQAKRDKR